MPVNDLKSDPDSIKIEDLNSSNISPSTSGKQDDIIAALLVDKTLIVKTVDFSASATAQPIWTPASGKKFVITDMIISVSAAGTLTVFDNTDNTTLRVFKTYLALNGGFIKSYRKPYVSASANNVLSYTTGTGIAGSITVSGYEI